LWRDKYEYMYNMYLYYFIIVYTLNQAVHEGRPTHTGIYKPSNTSVTCSHVEKILYMIIDNSQK